MSECSHDNAYWYSQATDTHEMRTYDEVICPECGETWDERVYCGKHFHQSKEEYLRKSK